MAASMQGYLSPGYHIAVGGSQDKLQVDIIFLSCLQVNHSCSATAADTLDNQT